ncbi:hypothetical protein BDN72DRAFT_905882 [Pluteus cervinus]|uniref:Uncharacterized protein n=1 Tax=Pluteus cervinus TaxID=181527 RepID=A0ACD3A186_9AGAR|nr:hypothetical protein BDN72DRAFT_905882 [Pluteus cervinus]
MSTAHEDEVFKLTLVSNRDDRATLGPFDGVVAALLDDGVHFVTSPNQPIIPAPPFGNRSVSRCIDGRFGMDDYIQWPQPYCANTPHYACIPRQIETAPNNIMWRDFREPDWSPVGSRTGGHSSQLGRVRTGLVQELHAAINPLLVRARHTLNQQPDRQKDDLLTTLIQALTTGLSVVEFTPRSYFQMKYAFRATQRIWVELFALLDYTETFRPRMDGLVSVPPETEIARTIGVFISTHNIAFVYHRARLPFWFVEKRTSFSDQNILLVTNLIRPETIINTSSAGGTLPYVSVGEHAVWAKFRAIQSADARTILSSDPSRTSTIPIQHPSPQAATLPQPSSSTSHAPSSSSSSPSPSNNNQHRSSLTHTSTSQKSHRSKFQGRRSKPAIRNNPATQANNAPPQAPGKPPYFPSSISSWSDARAKVNIDFTLVVISHQERSSTQTYFPDISMFITGSPQRRQRWFTIWPLIRQACTSRVATSFTSATPLAFQDWRTFLFAMPTPKLDPIRTAMTPTLAAYGISFDSLLQVPDGNMPDDDTARVLLWEMAEYNFRCDLVSLHHRIRRPDVTPSTGEERLAAALSIHPDSSGIFDFDQTSGTNGLASPVPQARIFVLRSLRQLMQCWSGDRPPILNANDPSISSAYIATLESAIATYFCQTFFNHFGRVPSIPFSLHPASG